MAKLSYIPWYIENKLKPVSTFYVETRNTLKPRDNVKIFKYNNEPVPAIFLEYLQEHHSTLTRDSFYYSLAFFTVGSYYETSSFQFLYDFFFKVNSSGGASLKGYNFLRHNGHCIFDAEDKKILVSFSVNPREGQEYEAGYIVYKFKDISLVINNDLLTNTKYDKFFKLFKKYVLDAPALYKIFKEVKIKQIEEDKYLPIDLNNNLDISIENRKRELINYYLNLQGYSTTLPLLDNEVYPPNVIRHEDVMFIIEEENSLLSDLDDMMRVLEVEYEEEEDLPF